MSVLMSCFTAFYDKFLNLPPPSEQNRSKSTASPSITARTCCFQCLDPHSLLAAPLVATNTLETIFAFRVRHCQCYQIVACNVHVIWVFCLFFFPGMDLYNLMKNLSKGSWHNVCYKLDIVYFRAGLDHITHIIFAVWFSKRVGPRTIDPRCFLSPHQYYLHPLLCALSPSSFMCLCS